MVSDEEDRGDKESLQPLDEQSVGRTAAARTSRFMKALRCQEGT